VRSPRRMPSRRAAIAAGSVASPWRNRQLRRGSPRRVAGQPLEGRVDEEQRLVLGQGVGDHEGQRPVGQHALDQRQRVLAKPRVPVHRATLPAPPVRLPTGVVAFRGHEQGRLRARPRDPDAVGRQRRLRTRQQRGVLRVLRHRHQRLAHPRGRPRHPRRRGHRAVRRVALHVQGGARVPGGRRRRAARRAARALERDLRDRALRAGLRRAGRRGLVRPRVRRPREPPAGRDPRRRARVARAARDRRGAGAA
jgi:hypothetical protein